MIKKLTIVLLAALFILPTVVAEAQTSVVLRGYATTGTNRMFGEPVHDFGGALGTIGFTNVAAYDPEGVFASPLTSDMDPSQVLASDVDPAFLALVGLPAELVNPELLNVPLRQIPVNVSPDGQHRVTLPGIHDTGSRLAPGLAAPNDPITLGQWLQASGTALVSCAGEVATVSLNMAGLVPNRIYTAWAIFGGQGLIPRPLGGVPNVIVTDGRGSARFERELNFCPLIDEPGEAPLLLIDVVLHSDHQVYGDVPDLPLNGFFTGIVTHTQLEFALAGEQIR